MNWNYLPLSRIPEMNSNANSFLCFQQTPRRLKHKQLEAHECLLNAVDTVALLLKHPAISIHGAD